MKLTDAKIRKLTTPGKHADGQGLYLEITPAGGRYWRLKYRHLTKEKRLSLGVYPEVSLKDARDKVAVARKAIENKIDPSAERQAEKQKKLAEAENTLQAVAAEWLKHQSNKWIPETKARIWHTLSIDLFPKLGDRALASIKPKEIMRAVLKVEARGAAEQAGRVLKIVKAIYRWAAIHGRIESNPMLDLVPGEILKPRDVQHRAALSEKDLPEFLQRLENYSGEPAIKNALKLLILTATRPGEVRGARWSELQLENALWVIPADRMKMGREHQIPLSLQALEVIETMRPLNGDCDLIFASPTYRSKPISENTLNGAIRRMGFDRATAHGFRSLFSTVTNEQDRTMGDVIERALAHQDRNKVRAAYLRSTFLADRVGLMQWWANYLDQKRKGAEVIQLKDHRAA
jgi:integrase